MWPSFLLILISLMTNASCVHDREMTYLNDQIQSLNKRVATLQQTLESQLGKELGIKLEGIYNSQAEMRVEIDGVKERLGGLEGRNLTRSTLRSFGAAAIMLAALIAWQTLTTSTPLIVRGGGGILLGGGVYLIAAYILRAEELSLVTGLLRRRLFRRSE